MISRDAQFQHYDLHAWPGHFVNFGLQNFGHLNENPRTVYTHDNAKILNRANWFHDHITLKEIRNALEIFKVFSFTNFSSLFQVGRGESSEHNLWDFDHQ